MTLRTKIYFYVFLASYFVGWSEADPILLNVVDGVRNYDHLFDYTSFAATLFFLCTIVILVEIFLHFRNRRSSQEN